MLPGKVILHLNAAAAHFPSTLAIPASKNRNGAGTSCESYPRWFALQVVGAVYGPSNI
jgi:hypothetical protein